MLRSFSFSWIASFWTMCTWILASSLNVFFWGILNDKLCHLIFLSPLCAMNFFQRLVVDCIMKDWIFKHIFPCMMYIQCLWLYAECFFLFFVFWLSNIPLGRNMYASFPLLQFLDFIHVFRIWVTFEKYASCISCLIKFYFSIEIILRLSLKPKDDSAFDLFRVKIIIGFKSRARSIRRRNLTA